MISHLIDDEFRDSRTPDFTEQLDLSKDARQVLAEDVYGFASTIGGDLVFGIRETGGVASAPVPVVIANLDEERQKLTEFLRDATEPRVTTALLTRIVPIDGGCFVVLRVSPSPNAPHCVLRNGKFYLRNWVRSESTDIHAIRAAFAYVDGLTERAIAFRDRLLALLEDGLAQVRVPVLALTRARHAFG